MVEVWGLMATTHSDHSKIFQAFLDEKYEFFAYHGCLFRRKKMVVNISLYDCIIPRKFVAI